MYSLTNHLDDITVGIVSPFVLGIMAIHKEPKGLLGYILLVIGLSVSYHMFRRRFCPKYRIVLTSRGMEVAPGRFYKWRSISNVQVVEEGYGRNCSYFLVYRHPKGKEKVQINGYNIDPSTLKELLAVYRKNGKQPK